jgi:hypothetical protein
MMICDVVCVWVERIGKEIREERGAREANDVI